LRALGTAHPALAQVCDLFLLVGTSHRPAPLDKEFYPKPVNTYQELLTAKNQ
jgi:hypothetical protein